MRTELRTLCNREVQSSDTLVFRKDLPKNMKISAIDVGFRFTNGATLAANKDALDIINHLTLLINGSEYRFHMNGHDTYLYNAIRNGSFMPSSFIDTASATTEFWLRMPFGRFLGDPNLGLDTSRYQNSQVQIDYALSNFGTVGTHVLTGTLAITILLHVFPVESQPSFQGMLAAKEFWTGTTVASRNNLQDLPSQRPITSIFVSNHEDAIEPEVNITDIQIGRDNMNKLWVNDKWYNRMHEQRIKLGPFVERFVVSPTAGAYLDTHITNIKRVHMLANTITAVT